ncbi:hypothetical protein [Azospirillum sp. OGB3]|uniref:hypothetical protein n=1 Tax=Azospirillum sp. OGB3 TaxID=2587012 RepID=UPI0016057BFC|nr:hypothetical protein [Azospirillum sp. OGB3]
MMPLMIAAGAQGVLAPNQLIALDIIAKAHGDAVPMERLHPSRRTSRFDGMIVAREDSTHWLVDDPGFPLDGVWLRRIKVTHRNVRRGLLRRNVRESYWIFAGESWAATGDPAVVADGRGGFALNGFGSFRWVDPMQALQCVVGCSAATPTAANQAAGNGSCRR